MKIGGTETFSSPLFPDSERNHEKLLLAWKRYWRYDRHCGDCLLLEYKRNLNVEIEQYLVTCKFGFFTSADIGFINRKVRLCDKLNERNKNEYFSATNPPIPAFNRRIPGEE